jgi:hypothetical protein
MERVGATPDLVFTDVQPALSLRQLTSVPVVFVPPTSPSETSDSDSDRWSRVDRKHQGPASPGSPRLHNFAIGGVPLAVPETHREDESRVVSQWQSHAEDFDLTEPFGRIREAIEEARRTAR